MFKIIIFFIIFVYDTIKTTEIKSNNYRRILNFDILNKNYEFFKILYSPDTITFCLLECQKTSNCKMVAYKSKFCYLIDQDYQYLKYSSETEIWQKSLINK